jgi:Family of unknown function (DUF5989)
MLSRLSIVGELFGFMTRGSRKYWLLPLVIALFVVMVMVVFAGATSVAPLLYPFF